MSDDTLPARPGDERWKDLATLPTTNFKIAVGIGLTVLTGWVYLGMVLLGRDGQISEAIFNSWLLFLLGVLGISAAQYIGKRMTYAAPSPDSERAGVPAEPPPQKPAAAPNEAGQPVPARLTIPSQATD